MIRASAGTPLRVVLMALSTALGLGALAIRARFHPLVPSAPELLWLMSPALLGASSAMSIPDRRGALWLLAGLLLAVAFTAIVYLQSAQGAATSGTGTLLPTFLPLWQLGLPILLWLIAWCVHTLTRRPGTR